jgi:hypothetical protein
MGAGRRLYSSMGGVLRAQLGSAAPLLRVVRHRRVSHGHGGGRRQRRRCIGRRRGRVGRGRGSIGRRGRAAKGEYGTLRVEALAGVPCGARAAVLRRGGCTARRRRGDICGAWWSGEPWPDGAVVCGEVDDMMHRESGWQRLARRILSRSRLPCAMPLDAVHT